MPGVKFRNYSVLSYGCPYSLLNDNGEPVGAMNRVSQANDMIVRLVRLVSRPYSSCGLAECRGLTTDVHFPLISTN
jgi:hypothetical protein